ncbi:MAG: hypothetical protein OEV49_08240 [candidate division Zixibacteria bacterium]|nr:hypothetical protein [candidate division Zixibacteria bacterium]MDH3936319.1 hypothetical protein [candidate division Zixibacteria bacterium]MDH4035540.1 hypothetical protein [candidate division Zixibacteria bacterium]
MPEIVIVPAMFLACVAIVKIVSDARTRNRLIEKGLVEEGVKNLYPRQTSPALSNLKWGLVLLGVGLGAMVSFFTDVVSEEGTLGLMCVLAGLAFLVYYAVASKDDKADRNGVS